MSINHLKLLHCNFFRIFVGSLKSPLLIDFTSGLRLNKKWIIQNWFISGTSLHWNRDEEKIEEARNRQFLHQHCSCRLLNDRDWMKITYFHVKNRALSKIFLATLGMHDQAVYMRCCNFTVYVRTNLLTHYMPDLMLHIQQVTDCCIEASRSLIENQKQLECWSA